MSGPTEPSAVRPFAGWLLRAEAAGSEITEMSEVAVAARRGPGEPHPNSYLPLDPALYVYRQRTDDGDHVGIVCDIDPAAFTDGRVRGHESVQPDRVEGLARFLATLPQRVELVSTLHRAGPVVTEALQRAVTQPPDLDVTGPNGAQHTVWHIEAGEAADALCAELGQATHYIADGHHRVAASLEVWERSGRNSGRGVLCVAYPLDGLRLASFDRRVIGPIDHNQVLTLLRESFVVTEVDDPRSAMSHGVAVYLNDRWYGARFAGERPVGSPGLDVSLLHELVLDRLDAEVELAKASLDELLAARAEDGGVLFALAPPDLDQLTSIADAGETVPAKSTFFSPKPGSGIFLRPAG